MVKKPLLGPHLAAPAAAATIHRLAALGRAAAAAAVTGRIQIDGDVAGAALKCLFQ